MNQPAHTMQPSDSSVARRGRQTGSVRPGSNGAAESKGKVAQVSYIAQYRLLKLLGAGALGSVYQAEDTLLRRHVAVRVISEKHARDGRFVSRFKREVRATESLRHPNIIQVYAVGDDLERRYVVMEYCEGQTLDDVLAQRGNGGKGRMGGMGRLGVGEALQLCIQVCRGLQHAHEHGLVHRDIKPRNILLCADGAAKILDLGLAKDLAESDSTLSVSPAEPGQVGPPQCNPHYMSPERAQGESDIDGRADVYSVGALLYHLLTGQTPFSAPGMATVILKHLYEGPPDAHAVNPSVPANVAHVIQRAMAKQRGERHASCAELAAELELVRAGRTPTQRVVRTHPAHPAHPAPPAPIRSALPIAAPDPGIVIPAPIQRQRAVRDSSRRAHAAGKSPRRRMLRRLAAYGIGVLAGAALLALVLLAMRGSQAPAATNEPEKSERK